MSPERTVSGGSPTAQVNRGPGDRPAPEPGRARGGRRRAVVFVLALLAIVVAAAWALLGSSLLVVRSVAVSVTGGEPVPRAEVLRAAGIKPGTPLARLDAAAVARRIGQLNQVQSVQVSRHWPDSVVIVVQTRTPALAVKTGDGFDLVDRFGVVVSQVPARPPGMVLLDTTTAPASLRGSPAVRAAVTVLGQLPERIRRLVRAVTAPAPDAVTLDLRGGATVLWGGTDRAAAKAAELEILMRTGATSYNLADPDTAVTGG